MWNVALNVRAISSCARRCVVATSCRVLFKSSHNKMKDLLKTLSFVLALMKRDNSQETGMHWRGGSLAELED